MDRAVAVISTIPSLRIVIMVGVGVLVVIFSTFCPVAGKFCHFYYA